VTVLEWMAVMLGLINVTLVVRRSVWNYPFGIVMVTLYAVIFYRAKLYSDALLQVFFFAVQFYGWHAWTRARAAAGEVIVERLSDRGRLAWAAGIVAATAGWGWLVHRFTDGSYPWWDAGVAVASVAAQVLMSQRRIENWWLWICVDVASIGLYAAKGLYPTMILYTVFLGLAIWGLLHWGAARRLTGPAAA
jgi:nicotinamide mononucleotide transporter